MHFSNMILYNMGKQLPLLSRYYLHQQSTSTKITIIYSMKISKKLLAAAISGALFATSCSTDQEAFKPTIADKAVAADAGLVVNAPNNGDVIPGQYIVVMKGNAFDMARFRGIADYKARTTAFRSAIVETFGKAGITEENLEQAYSSTITGFSARLDENTLENLKKNPNVNFIEPDRIMALARPGTGGGGTSPSQETPWGITRVGGSVNYTGSGKAYVLDSGVDLNHPDLKVASYGFNAFTSGKDGRSMDDGNGHGTHVAGTIGAINNSIGVVGVAAGVTIVPVKVLGATGSGSYSGVIAGVDYVGANGNAGDVANMSLGGPISEALDAAILAASSKVKFALAAGNESQNANNTSPARVNGSNIYTISASDINDNFASFSNFANPPVDFAEPGVSIKSTWKDGGYNTISGTSMASPHAAGLLLLGAIRNGGTVSGDRDNNPDNIGVR